MKSDRILRFSVLAQVALLGACSQKPAEEAATEAVPVETAKVEPLGDAELLGLERDKVVLTLPWADGPMSHQAADSTVRPSLRTVALTAGDGFDRAEFEFVEYFNLPGYRVLWNDTSAVSCRNSKTPTSSHLLFVELEPATGKDRKGPSTVAPSGSPTTAIDRARQLCDDDSRVVWALEADSAQVRVTEMRNPPRLVVDVKHGGVAKSPAAPAGR